MAKSSSKTKQKGRKVETSRVPSFRGGHLPAEEDVKRLRTLSAPHVESFNYFLEHGLDRGIKSIEPAEFSIVDPTVLRENPSSIDWNETATVKYWVESVKIAKPVKASSGNSNKLLPRECRERGLMYSGPISGNFCYSVIQRRNGVEIPSKPVRIEKSFGNMPIMILSTGCHLYGSTPKELVKYKEEVCIVLLGSKVEIDRPLLLVSGLSPPSLEAHTHSSTISLSLSL